MKILWLYSFNDRNSYPHWYTGDFFRILNSFPNVEIKCYGKNVHMCHYPDMHLIKYSSKVNLPMKELKKIFDFDIILLSSKMRYSYYKNEEWLPHDFNTFDCPKVLVEGDYHNHRKSSWFKDSNINLILHRHLSNVGRGIEDFPSIPQQWFPVSVDTSVFKPLKNGNEKIGFIGSIDINKKIYIHRIKAIEFLQQKNLLVSHVNHDKEYPNILQKNIAFLNGSSIYDIDNAKAFEIMASGKILLTNRCQNGFADLFGKNTYITYENNLIDLDFKVRQIINDSEYRKQIQQNALQVINKYHTHKIRAGEFLNILGGL